MSRKVKFRVKRQNRFGMFLVTTVVLMLLVVVSYKSVELKQQLEANELRAEQYEEKIAKEEKRTEDLAEYKKYTQTKAFVEELAKETFDLVRKDEIVFKTE